MDSEIPKKDDTTLAIGILIAVLVIVGTIGIYIWINYKKYFGVDSSWENKTFTPPPEREIYLKAKESLDINNPIDLDQLKKLLMKRTIKAIPVLLSLQQEGTSIERLYKKGMLTDDMHFKVKELKSFVDQEFQEIQFEADELNEGWGQHIWPQAMQFHQMIQKQAESKQDEKKVAEDEKKKSDNQKKREKEKAKKLAAKQAIESSESTSPIEIDATVEADEIDLDKIKELEAERLAQELIQEEEKEKQNRKKKNGKSKK